MRDEELAEVNSCLEPFEVTMYRGGDGKYRIWGDINRIQDIIFSDCVETFPAGARADLDWFFAHEVDAHVVRNFERLGLRVAYDPADKIGFSFDGDGPSDEQMTEAFRSTYDWYRIPPDERVDPGER